MASRQRVHTTTTTTPSPTVGRAEPRRHVLVPRLFATWVLVALVCACCRGRSDGALHRRAPALRGGHPFGAVGAREGQTGPDTGVRSKCIMGAGASGMSTAAFLKDLGYDVLVLEQTAEGATPGTEAIGGACNTYHFTNSQTGLPQVVDPGVIVFPNTTLAKQSGCSTWTISTPKFIERFAGPDTLAVEPFGGVSAIYVGDLQHGAFFGPIVPSPPDPAQFSRLVEFITTRYPWADVADFPNPIPRELTQSFTQWLDEFNFTDMEASYFNGHLYYSGFGPNDNLTALYAIMDTSCTDLLFETNPASWMFLPGGCIQIYNGIRKYIGAENVLTGVRITDARRPPPASHGAPVTLTGTRNGAPFSVRCRDLILAFAPTLEAVQFMHPDPVEEALYAHVFARAYWAGVANLSGPLVSDTEGTWEFSNIDVFDGPLSQPPPPFLTGFDFVVRTDGPTPFQGFAFDVPSETEILDVTLQQLARAVNMTPIPPGADETAFTDVSLLQLVPHQYNPHFDASALVQPISPYAALDALQGYRCVHPCLYVCVCMRAPHPALVPPCQYFFPHRPPPP